MICAHCGERTELDFLELWPTEQAFILDACCGARCEDLQDGLVESCQLPLQERVAYLKPLRDLFAVYGIDLRQVFYDEAELRWRFDHGVEIRPVGQTEAKEFITTHHRHNRAPAGWRYGAGIYNGADLVGVVWVGRPVARALDPAAVVEVNRLCVRADIPRELVWNACSKGYGWAAREARKRGYQSIITYTLDSEDATTLRAVGWKVDGTTKGGSWNTPSRPRTDKAPTCKKVRWASHFPRARIRVAIDT